MKIVITESELFSPAALAMLGTMGEVRALDLATREELLAAARTVMGGRTSSRWVARPGRSVSSGPTERSFA